MNNGILKKDWKEEQDVELRQWEERRRAMNWAQRIGMLVLRLALTAGVTALLLWLPDPAPDETLRLKNAIVVLVAIVTAGKLIADTFFYDRYAGKL